MIRITPLLAALLLAGYTQFALLTEVPGLHFDEAWQGMFAHRILSEPGFWPLSAMNSYTSPVIHYLLAAAFSLFAPSLEVMRGTYAILNLISLALLLGFLRRIGERAAMPWFALLWALLPLAVHNHRFYVEVTGLHTLCLATVLWGLALWKSKPTLSFVLIAAGTLIGTYSHVLFIAVFFATLAIAIREFPKETSSPRGRRLIAVLALLLLPLPIRMGLGLGKLSPFILAAGLAGTAIWFLAYANFARFKVVIDRWPNWATRFSIPFLIAFVGLLWNGFWPYAQATGSLELRWLPLNAALFIGLLYFEHKTIDRKARLLWTSFIALFAITSILILKQTPRYYAMPMALAMTWAAIRLSRIRSGRAQLLIAVTFVAWNLWAFEFPYVRQFQANGSTTKEFKFLIFHDNGRDFRPFQKVFRYAIEQNCQQTLRWVEDDRFSNPVEFLRLTAPSQRGTCPWPQNDLFFSHIPDYDPAMNGRRTAENTKPPVENVKFLAHFPEWGDLALWIRR